MRRRDVVAVAAAAAMAWPVVAPAQQFGIWRIGFLTPRARPSAPDRDAFSNAFMQGMRDLGYVDGKTLLVEWRYADGDYKRLAGFAAELVGLDLRVIVTYGTAAARALQEATRTVPIVVAAAVDLVGAGIVASLARPGGNITGLSVIDVDMSAKQLELLQAVSPALSRVAVLMNPGNPANPAVLRHVQAIAPGFGTEVVALNAATPPAIQSALAAAAQQGAGAVIIAADAFFSGQGAQLAALALQYRLAAISLYEDHVRAGCLMSYGQNVAEFHRQAATFVDKILKGARPTGLPVEQPTKIPLMINLKTATALGLTVPAHLLVQAEEVIE